MNKKGFKNKNISIFTLIFVYILFGLLFIMLVVGVNIDSIRVSDLFDVNSRKVYDELNKIIDSQDSSIVKIKEASKNKNYNFNNPYVLVNPFGLNPCSAIMVFNVEEPSKVNVVINDKNVGTTEAGSLHVIPLYGLYENNYNRVILTLDDGSQHEETILTEDIYSNISVGKTDRDPNSTYLSYFASGDMTTIYGYNYYNDVNVFISGLNYVSSFKVNNDGLTFEYNNKKELNSILVDIDYLGRIKQVYKKSNTYSSENNVNVVLYENGINEYSLGKSKNEEELTEYNVLDLDSTINYLSKAHLYFKEFDVSVNGSYLTYKLNEKGYLILVRNDGLILSYYIDDAKNIKIDNSYEYSLFLNTDNTYYNLYTTIKK